MTSNPRMCIIGAGLSGLCMGIQLKAKLNLGSFTIYEVCEEVGGTWLVNTYPGLECDVPSHLYTLSFCPKYDWSRNYSPQTEILEYVKHVATKYELYPFIKFHSRVECLRWEEKEMKWHATILNTRTNCKTEETFDLVINSTGKNRIPHYPQEFLGFEGKLVHSARWDSSLCLSGKRVGIIGTGASAVQIIIALAQEVKHLSVFQRRAPHVLPRLQHNYSEMSKWVFANIPGLYHLSRLSYFWSHELFYGATRYNSVSNKIVGKISRWFRNSRIKDPILLEKVTPNYTVVCKRLILSENYYGALLRDNVELITEGITGLEGNRVKTRDGRAHELDVLILATGYKSHDFFAPMKVYGRGGVDVLEKWKRERPRCYMGIASRDMPNFFTILGPYTALGHNSNMFNIECQVDWTILAIMKMLEKGAKSISITEEAEDKFLEFIDKTLEGSVWTAEDCGAWYFDEKGRNTMLWPDTQVEFWRWCRSAEETLFEFGK